MITHTYAPLSVCARTMEGPAANQIHMVGHAVFKCCPILQKLGERHRDMEMDCKRAYLFVQRLRNRYYYVVIAVCFDFSPLSFFLGSQTRATKQCSCHCWRKLLILLSAAWSAQTGDWRLMRDWGVHRDQRVCYAIVGKRKRVVVCKVCVDTGRNIDKP